MSANCDQNALLWLLMKFLVRLIRADNTISPLSHVTSNIAERKVLLFRLWYIYVFLAMDRLTLALLDKSFSYY